MRKNVSIILLGLALMCFSVGMIGNLAGWWNIVSFDGWWTLFLIIPGISEIIKSGFSFWNVGITWLGVWLLINAQQESWGISSEMFLAGSLFVFGAMVIIFAIKKSKGTNDNSIGMESIKNGDSVANYSALFSGSKVVNSSQELAKVNVSATFGGVQLDLSDAKFIDGAVIKAYAVFGGIDIKMPKGCRVKTSGIPIFGGLKNTYSDSIVEGGPLVLVEYSATFAGIELK